MKVSNRPDNMSAYGERDLKLGIKSSLPHVKSTLALAILFWEASKKPSELVYSKQNGSLIDITDELLTSFCSCFSDILDSYHIGKNAVKNLLNNNQLYKSQLESLIVAFELVWKLSIVTFVDEQMSASSERTGGVRYPKKLKYSINVDLIHNIITCDRDAFFRVLLDWVGFPIGFKKEKEQVLVNTFTYLAESAIFKLRNGSEDVIFNQDSIYRKSLETSETVDVKGDDEAKGSLRILKTLLSEDLNPFYHYNDGFVTVQGREEDLESYQKRVDIYLQLSATKVIFREEKIPNEQENDITDYSQIERKTGGKNILLYGVPGSGKSWTIEHEYCKADSIVERIVFHQEYTYADFVGQILPDVSDDGFVSYKFTPGPFTNILSESYRNPQKDYILVIEEINRGNAPAIFGDVFQLLDRKVEINPYNDDGFPVGTSVYGITNMNIAEVMYGKERKTEKVRIPSNLSIIGTMNTSDQNVFTLDTAFQRRWNMRLIENNFDNVDSTFADAKILDTGVIWKRFCLVINKFIVGNNARMTSSEDKRIGAYFIHPSDLQYASEMGDLAEYDVLRKKESAGGNLSTKETIRIAEIRDAMKQNRKFPEKVIKYLWDDVFKFNRETIFDTPTYKSLEDVIHAFMYAQGADRFNIFKGEVKSSLIESVAE